MSILLFANSARNRVIAKTAIAGLTIGLVASLIVGERPSPHASTKSSSAMPQAAFFGYWSVEDGLRSSVVINNASNTQMTVNPTLYNLGGQPLAVKPIVLAPQQQLTAHVADWLAQGGASGDFTQGNLVLNYEAPEAAYIGAQVTVTNAASSLSFDFRDEMPMSFESSRLEGLWWQPAGASRYDLVLSNMESAKVKVTVSTSGEQGLSEDSSFAVALAPHQTQIVRLDEKKLPFTISPAAGKFGGISITHSGAPGAVLACGMLSNKETGFSSHFPFEDPATSRSQVLAASHVLAGKPDVPGFSEETTFTSMALLRNASDAPIDVEPAISFIYKGAPRTTKLGLRHLLPQQVDALEIGAELKRAGIRGPISGTGATLTSTGKPGALVAHLTSYDQTRNHTFDVPLKDPAVAMNRFGGSYPWTLEGDAQSIIHVRNTTDDTSLFTIELNWEGGSYALPIQQLDPQQEAAIDIRKLRDSQEQDSIGRVIPSTVTNGQANWFEHGEQALIGRAEVFAVSSALASSFSCGANCCLPETSEVYTDPATISGVPGNSFQVKLMERRWRECDGASSGPYNVTTQASWFSSNTSVATTGTATSNGVPVSFVGAGSAIISGTFNGIVSEYNFINHLCQVSHPPFTGQATAAVAPKINSISPAFGAPATTVQVTISGLGFGTDSFALVDGTGISVIITDKTSTQLTASFDISLNATAGDHSVTVTSNNKTSNSKTFSVRIPDHLVVVSDQGFVVSNCAFGMPVLRALTFKVVDSNGNSVGAVQIQENFTNVSTNTCRSDGRGPLPDGCAYTDAVGNFADGISVDCNTVNGFCGYNITDQWQWCPPGGSARTLATLTEIVHADQVTVNGNTSGFSQGTIIRP